MLLAVHRRLAPLLVLNLQPVPSMDYPNTDAGAWLANCCACCVPEISNAFARSHIQFNVVSGLLFPAEGNAAQYFARGWREIEEWVKAAGVLRKLAYARVGFLGHTYPGMLDMYSDFADGESIPGSRLEIGNTNPRLRFGLDPATFLDRWCEHGPTHHVALGVGHQLGKIRKLARLLDLELAVVG